ncbi:hypothetical protein QLQ80_01960 [Mycoplasma sp. M5725]|uniref:Uncharacterized protein n=1 Tax=Mycoplasma phocimorsus TaxID=3045839 RepID=A0AAJ1PSQ6_9MOLU|nr:hypothetical protein [Mycoplasma phocimorsus]MDJ1645851.1 hypothetical protein [Mycoplasma phocimorsus]MDJ1648003.1 hypothetical protein [Mycoplasma phocimorsus]
MKFKIALTSTGILLGIVAISTGIIAHNLNKKQVNIFSLEKPKQLIKVEKLNISEKLKINKEAFLKKQEINLLKVVNLESAVVELQAADQVKLEKIQDKISEKINKTFSLKPKKTDILKWMIENPYKTAGIISSGIIGSSLVATTLFFTTLFMVKHDEYISFLALLKTKGILNTQEN